MYSFSSFGIFAKSMLHVRHCNRAGDMRQNQPDMRVAQKSSKNKIHSPMLSMGLRWVNILTF